MVIMTAKVSKRKILLIGLLIILAVVVLITCLQQEPVQTQQVRVPEDPSEVFLRYNDLQQSQGYDLLSYSGKTLTRYVYQITNYPGSDGVYFATLLIYNDSVVGGDVASSRQNGVMHGFSMPAAQPSSGAFLPESEEISENLS